MPEGLRGCGFPVLTMAEAYGNEAQTVSDPTWIEEMTGRNLVLLSKDARMRTAHVDVITACGAKVFLLPDQQAPARAMIARFVEHRYRIGNRCRKPGPFIYMLHPAEVTKQPVAQSSLSLPQSR